MKRPIVELIDNLIKMLEEQGGKKISDNKLSAMLGRNANEVFYIRRGSTPSPETCEKLADLSGEPLEKVLLMASLSDRKASEKVKEAWDNIWKRAGNFIFALAVIVGGVLLASPAEAATTALASKCASSAFNNPALWILCQIRKITERLFNRQRSSSTPLQLKFA